MAEEMREEESYTIGSSLIAIGTLLSYPPPCLTMAFRLSLYYLSYCGFSLLSLKIV